MQKSIDKTLFLFKKPYDKKLRINDLKPYF